MLAEFALKPEDGIAHFMDALRIQTASGSSRMRPRGGQQSGASASRALSSMGVGLNLDFSRPQATHSITLRIRSGGVRAV